MKLNSLVSMLVALSLSACGLLDGGGGGGGGGGGNDAGVAFTKGFVFVRGDDRNLFVIDDANQDAVAKLTTTGDVATPSLSKDGKRIVFARRISATNSELDLVSSSGGAVSVLLASTATAKNLRTPVFAPAQDKVAFTYDDGTGTSVGLVNVDGSNFVRVVGGSTTEYAFPSFLSDTELIVASGTVGLRRYTTVERVNLMTGQSAIVTNTLGNEVQAISSRISVSPDKTKVVFDGVLTATAATRLFTLDLSTKQVSARLNDYVSEPNANDSAPLFIDNATVVYSSNSGGNDNVYKVGLASMGRDRTLLVPKAIEAWYGP